LRAHGHHRCREVLLEGAPAEALRALDGQIWSRIVKSDEEMRALESSLRVLSSHLSKGSMRSACLRKASRARIPAGCLKP